MAFSLAFVLAPPGRTLPQDSPSWAELIEVQQQALCRGHALRIFRSPQHWTGSLEALVADGLATAAGEDPFNRRPSPTAEARTASERSTICDAVIPHFHPESTEIGIYQLESEGSHPSGNSPGTITAIQLLDQFPLALVENETCWFYPTETGTYLDWRSQRRFTSCPGWLPEQASRESPFRFDRGDLRLLWSLMADDGAMTCVGLTHQKRRIDWPLEHVEPESDTSWSCFRVDPMAADPCRVIATVATPGSPLRPACPT